MNGPVAPDELLARYIFFRGWIRSSNQTVKPDAFIPSNTELSVTRHLNLTEEKIWKIGRRIAGGMSTPRLLHGRADVETCHVIAQGLDVVSQPVLDNPNHANIVNWPAEKNARKMCALEIATAARFVANHEG
jgi:hypothetical protein